MTTRGDDLAVGLGDRLVGTLRRVRNGARFSYEPDVIERLSGAPLLSTSLPVRAREFDAGTTACWFRGLLPEDDRLDQVRRFYGIEGDYLDVLEQVGWECAGAVSVMSRRRWDMMASRSSSPDDIAPVAPDDLAARLSSLPSHPFDTPETLRMSLGGFQSKLCVIAPRLRPGVSHTSADGITLPLSGTPSTHILKPEPVRFAHLAQAEAWAMTVSSAVTPTARVALLDLPSAPPTLCVERFDRKIVDGVVRRVHQEDCAQAIGIEPERKYAAQGIPTKGDPSFARIAGMLRLYATDVPHELARLFDQMVANVALGNTDAHAKNYSLMHPGPHTVTLAPMYDVVPALEITPQIRHMGMRIAGQISIDRIGRGQLLDEGVGWGMAREGLEKRLDRDLDLLEEGVRVAAALFPDAAARHEAPARARLMSLRR